MAEFEKAHMKITEDMRRALRQMANTGWSNTLDGERRVRVTDDMVKALQTPMTVDFTNHVDVPESDFFATLQAPTEGNTNQGDN